MAEKLALIDKDLLLRLLGRTNPQPPINTSLRELSRAESELDDVISKSASPTQVKEIGNIITKRNFHKSNYENVPQSPPILTQAVQKSGVEDDPWASNTIETAPDKFQRNTKSLLEHIKKSGRLQWGQDGRLIKDGRVIPDTNILDLVHSLVRPRPTLRPPTGFAEFLETLQSTNVPRELMLNADNILKKLNKNVSKKKSKQGPPSRAPSFEESPPPTPTASRKKRRKRTRVTDDATPFSTPLSTRKKWMSIEDDDE